jgi:hypothetical protein
VREKDIVNEELLENPQCLNLCTGGDGGFTHDLNSKIWNDINFRKRHSDRLKQMHQDNKFKVPNWTGKYHNEQSKIKIGIANKIKQSGKFNSQYGTIWITNGIENKKIKKETIIPNGWYKGYNPKK